MGPVTRSTVAVLISTTILLLLSASTAHNITRILDQYPDFAQFNALLSQTHLADIINSRKTITVLAVTNDRVGELAGKPDDVIKRILSTHVVLDYFDPLKLNKFQGSHNIFTTLYQATGTADDQQGFLNVAHTQGGIFFGSAMKGAPIDARLQGSVASQPYNISVLSVSHVIVAPGIDGSWRPIGAPPPEVAAEAPPMTSPPAESPEDDLPEDVQAPESEAPSPVDATTPGNSPASAPGPDADADADDADGDQRANAADRAVFSAALIGLAVAFTSLWI